MITISYEEYEALKRLSDFADFYIDDMEPSSPCYEDDKEDIRAAQEILNKIEMRV